MGSAALDMANVACGRIDGFWEFGLKAWDVAAGCLIIEESGGRCTEMDGTELDMEQLFPRSGEQLSKQSESAEARVGVALGGGR